METGAEPGAATHKRAKPECALRDLADARADSGKAEADREGVLDDSCAVWSEFALCVEELDVRRQRGCNGVRPAQLLRADALVVVAVQQAQRGLTRLTLDAG